MNYLRNLCCIVICGCFLLSCDEESDPVRVGSNPEITSANIRTNWNLLSDKAVPVEVTVADPQGTTNIATVIMEVKNAVDQLIYSDSLYDDGRVLYPDAGDVFARDGVFRNHFIPSTIALSSGIYRLTFQASDLDDNTSDLFEKAIQFGFNVRPEIITLQAPDSLPSRGNGYLQAAVSDENGTDEIEKVVFDVFREAEKLTLQPIEMFDDGDFESHGDLFAKDSVFSFKLDSGFAAGRKGWYDLHYYAIDPFEAGSEKISHIYLENKSGQISNLSVADSLEKPGEINQLNTSKITIRADDPQGLTDIDSVYFFSLKPNNQYANRGAPFLMFDNGSASSGDDFAGDGIYTLTVKITGDPAILLGTYTYTFYMRDKTGNLANVLVDSIEVYQ